MANEKGKCEFVVLEQMLYLISLVYEMQLKFVFNNSFK